MEKNCIIMKKKKNDLQKLGDGYMAYYILKELNSILQYSTTSKLSLL